MEHGGNAKVNAIFEARLPPNSNTKPTNHADGPTRERFIRDKYERRKYYDATGISNVPQNGVVSPQSASNEEASVGPPSDAAKQRLEQRRARINKSSSTVNPAPAASTLSKSRPKIAKAPASAPPPQSVDLLGFDTPSEPTKTSTSTTTAPATSSESSEFDLFAFTSSNNNTNDTTNDNNNSFNKQWNEFSTSNVSQQQQQSKPSLDLASLYNGVQHQQQQQPMGFVNFPSGNTNMYAMGSNPMMMHGNSNQNMQQMNVAIQNMNLSSNMTPQQVAYQQQQQQQQMMMMQHQQMMMQQQQQAMLMSQQQPGMMHQHQHHQQQHFPNSMGNHFGPSSTTTPNKSKMSTKTSAAPEKEDPFAQFGTNMFR
jgi:hypothetical protein